MAALAFPGQGRQWPSEALAQLDGLLERASLVHIAFEKRSPDMWTLRDRWVVDRGDRVMALWSGVVGGTATAVEYANMTGKPVENLWNAWHDSELQMR